MGHTHTRSQEQEGSSAVDRALAAFQGGEPVLVHDAADREGETDILYPAEAAIPSAIARLRNDGGGLIFVAVPDPIAEAFDLPFLHDLIDHPSAEFDDLGYDVRPSFSLTVNHRDTYTGITDDDRSLTVRSLADAARSPGTFDFAATFRAPGHVHVLRGAPKLLDDREGHTELGLALAQEAGIAPAVVGAEMLDDTSGGALAPAEARAYARREGLVYIEGSELIDHLR